MTQYLVLHKCRGEVTFYCAEEIEPDMWITIAGHRCYPYETWKLDDIRKDQQGDVHGLELGGSFEGWLKDEPDMFQVEGEKPPSNFNVMAAISNLLPKIRRRV